MIKTNKINKNWLKVFDIIINPKLDEKINWKNLSISKINIKLKETNF